MPGLWELGVADALFRCTNYCIIAVLGGYHAGCVKTSIPASTGDQEWFHVFEVILKLVESA